MTTQMPSFMRSNSETTPMQPAAPREAFVDITKGFAEFCGRDSPGFSASLSVT